jgi:hypothetical protein
VCAYEQAAQPFTSVTANCTLSTKSWSTSFFLLFTIILDAAPGISTKARYISPELNFFLYSVLELIVSGIFIFLSISAF